MQSDPGIYQRNPPGGCHLDQLSYIGTHTLYMLRLFQFHTLTNTGTFTFSELTSENTKDRVTILG